MANNPEHISENHTVQTISLINYFLIFYSGTVVTKSYYQLLESVTTGMKRNKKWVPGFGNNTVSYTYISITALLSIPFRQNKNRITWIQFPTANWQISIRDPSSVCGAADSWSQTSECYFVSAFDNPPRNLIR